MRFATVAALVGSASAAIQFGPGSPGWSGESSGWGSETSAPNGTVVYTTDVVTAFTTYCPEATQLTHNGQTYTITEATTLTITNCPCTVTKPVYSSSTPAAPVSETPSSSPVAPASYTSPASSPAAPVSYSSPAPYVPVNGTTTAPAGTAPAGTGSPVTTPASSPVSPATGSPIASYTGAATKAQVVGVSFLALFGLVAAL